MFASKRARSRALAWCLASWMVAACSGGGETAAVRPEVADARVERLAEGPELVKNGRFTHGLDGWTTWLQDGGDAAFAAKGGHAVVRVKAPATTDWGIQLHTGGVALSAGRTYRLSFRARAEVPATIAGLVWENGKDVNADGSPWSTYQYASYAVGTEWARYTADFNMAFEDVDAGVCFFLGQVTDEVFIDDVSVKEVLPPAPGTELVANGDFRAHLRGWETWVEDGAAATFETRKGAAAVTVKTPATAVWGVQLHRGALPLFEGHRYQFSFTAWAAAPTSIDALVEENGQDVNGDGNVWTTYTYGTYALEAEPKRYTATFQAPITNADAAVFFFLGQAAGKVFIDDVSVVEVPPPAVWRRPPQPAAPAAAGLSFVQDAEHGATWFFADGELLALFNNQGNTFPEFWVDGVNVIGGYAPAGGATNWGPPVKGHPAGYPYGQFDAAAYAYGPWEGFWSGYNYIDTRWGRWIGPNGNPGATRSFDVQPTSDGRLDAHLVAEIDGEGMSLYALDVHYYVSKAGIGVRDDVTVLSDLLPWGFGDTGAQFLMTQADSDIDPALPLDRNQPDQYFQLAFDGTVQDIDPFPPYGKYSPSVEYTDAENLAPPYFRQYGLPGGALVPTDLPRTYLTAMGRKSRAVNLALRVDQARSTLPQLEYYCEVNGFRDYFNYDYSAALGWNGPDVIPAGTRWRLYGDLLPWMGADPDALRAIPLLSDGIP